MGHGLFAVNGFSSPNRVDDKLFMPMIGDGGQDAVDFFVVKEIFVAARDVETGFGGDFAGEEMAAVVKICGGDAFDAREGEGVGEDAGTFHADADDAESETVAGRDRGVGGGIEASVVEEDGVRGGEDAGGGCGAVEELASGEVFGHGFGSLVR
jgi:hypothetical protein